MKGMSNYWLMVFYFCMAVGTAGMSLYLVDYTWVLLAIGSALLGLSSRRSYIAQKQASDDELENKADVLSRIGFLFLAAGLLSNTFNS